MALRSSDRGRGTGRWLGGVKEAKRKAGKTTAVPGAAHQEGKGRKRESQEEVMVEQSVPQATCHLASAALPE